MPLVNSNERLQKLEKLVSVCRSLGTSADLESLLQTVVTASEDLTQSEVCAILLYEEETDLLRFVAGPVSRKQTSRRLRVPIDRSVAGLVYTQSKPAVILDASRDGRVRQDSESPLGVIIQSMVAVPLVFRGETIGVLETFNKRGGAYNEEDVIILETLAAQAAVATLSTLLMEETERAYEQVSELEKMKSEFIAVASHELRTPLGLILGHATFLSDAIQDTTQHHQLEVIIRSATRLKSIIEDLSNMNAYQQGKTTIRHRTIAISDWIPRVSAAFEEMARRKRIQISTRLSGASTTIEGDEEKLTIALGNLLSNALTFTNENGHVLIATENIPGYVKISVIDNGIGIPAKDLPRVFERFYQVQSHLTRRHGGMGLGLSVAKAMVELHNGQIWVESVEGRGSNFSILLPVKGGEGATKTPAFTE